MLTVIAGRYRRRIRAGNRRKQSFHGLYRKPYRISRICVSTAGMKVVTRVITSSFTKDGVFFCAISREEKYFWRAARACVRLRGKNILRRATRARDAKNALRFFAFRSCLSQVNSRSIAANQERRKEHKTCRFMRNCRQEACLRR